MPSSNFLAWQVVDSSGISTTAITIPSPDSLTSPLSFIPSQLQDNDLNAGIKSQQFRQAKVVVFSFSVDSLTSGQMRQLVRLWVSGNILLDKLGLHQQPINTWFNFTEERTIQSQDPIYGTLPQKKYQLHTKGFPGPKAQSLWQPDGGAVTSDPSLVTSVYTLNGLPDELIGTENKTRQINCLFNELRQRMHKVVVSDWAITLKHQINKQLKKRMKKRYTFDSS